MFKHLVAVVNTNHTQSLYFVGYKDDGEICETIWTNDYWKAMWFEADDAELEAMLLAVFCPSYQVETRQVSGVSVRRH